MIEAPYSPAFGPSGAPGVVYGGSESDQAEASAVSVYAQVLSANTSPQTDQKAAEQQREISSLRARLFEYKGEVEKLSLTASLVASLESELKIGVVEELYAVSVDLYDTKLRLREVLETSLQVLLVSYPQAGTGVACHSLRPTKSADEPLETCSNIPCIEMVCRRSH